MQRRERTIDPNSFARRHIGPNEDEARAMLRKVGFESLDNLVEAAVPKNIRIDRELNLPEPKSEMEALAELRAISRKNKIARSFIGCGYSDCITPPVIQRNILENPGWYTAYTPYQAELAQGRLEALVNFQTMITDLTGLEIANASLLDEATAAAEAMALCHAVAPNRKTFVVADNCHPQTIAVVQTRAKPLGITIKIGDYSHLKFDESVFGALVQYPATDGAIYDYTDFIKQAHDAGALVVVAADILALTLLRPPGEFGVDVAIGNTQRFGVPLGFGGPHAAYFATRDQYKRHMPGRLVGVSHDAEGRPAYRLASANTRATHPPRQGNEQHLHCAGPSGCHRFDVCRVSRPKRFACNRRTDPPPDESTRGWLARSWLENHARKFLRHYPRRSRVKRTHLRTRAKSRLQLARARPTRSRHFLRRNHDASGPRAVNVGLSRHNRARFCRRRSGTAANPHSSIRNPHVRISRPPRLQHSRHRNRNAALSQEARIARSFADDFDDPARFVHDEAERNRRNVSDIVAGNFQATSVCAHRTNNRLCRDVRTAGKLACRNHGIRCDFIATQCWIAGRIRGSTGDPRVSCFAQRSPSQYLPYTDLGPRHEPSQRNHGWFQGCLGSLLERWRYRSCRSALKGR